MEGSRRRASRRLCFALAGVCALGALTGPARAQEEDTVPPPEVFRGEATSLVASVGTDREALLPVPSVFRFIALDTASIYEGDRQTARASIFFPGNGIMQGPNLVCGTFGGSFPPEFEPVLDLCLQYDFPLSVSADASRPHRETTGSVALGDPSDPVSGDGAAARADATPDGASSFATLNELRVLGLPAFGAVALPLDAFELDTSVVVVDSATSRTTQDIVRGSLEVRSESIMNGVKLVGGLVQIGSIKSVSVATDDAAGKRTADASLEVSGVTVAGIPAQITEDGLVLGSPAGSGPLHQAALAVVNQLVQGLGLRVTVLDQNEQTDDGTGLAKASVGGLLVEVSTEAQGLPTLPAPPPLGQVDLNGTYVSTVVLGQTAANAGAVNFEDPPIVDPGITPPVDDGFADPGTGTFDPGPDDGLPTDTSTPPAEQPSSEAPDLVRRVVDTFGGRMGLLYLSFAFAVFGLCLMPRLLLPARLPGPRS